MSRTKALILSPIIPNNRRTTAAGKSSALARLVRHACSAALVVSTLIITNTAHAQCLKVTTVRGKARLSTTSPDFFGKCPSGTVAIGSATGAVGAPGAQGPQGPQGPQGSQGPAGARGPSAFDTIPSGTTVYGTIGFYDYRNSDYLIQMYASLPALANTPISFENVIIKANEELLEECSAMVCLSARQQAAQGLCQGSNTNPRAAPGAVCVYPTLVSGGFRNGSLGGYNIAPGSSSGIRSGFSVGYLPNSSTHHNFEAVWAYTAP
jgi:hypothetical protein